MGFLIKEKFLFTGKSYTTSPILKEGDYWLGIFYEGKRAGFCHVVNSPFSMKLYAELLLNFLGKRQSVKIDGSSDFETDGKIQSFSFRFTSGEYELKAYGIDDGKDFLIKVDSGGSPTKIKLHGDIKLSDFSVPEFDLLPGEKRKLSLINPVTGMRETAAIKMLGYENFKGIKVKVARVDYCGSTSKFWIGDYGEIVKSEIPRGFTLVRE